jgi:hypothetical protein
MCTINMTLVPETNQKEGLIFRGAGRKRTILIECAKGRIPAMLFPALLRRAAFGIVSTLVIGVATFSPTLAAESSVTQQITSGGSLTASISNATMTSIGYSNVARPAGSTGVLLLSVNDPRGSSTGWNVTVQSTDFVWQGSGNASALDIPVTGFVITSVGTPTIVAGQAVDPLGGPRAESGAVASLSQARKTISASAGFGSGAYSQSIPVALDIPALSQSGTYVATLTVLITSAP